MMKKGIWISIIAAVAAVAAAAIAVAAYIKRKSATLSDHLDYDPEEYFVADDELDEEAEEDAKPEEGCCCECETVDEDLDCSDCPFTEEDADEDKQ